MISLHNPSMRNYSIFEVLRNILHQWIWRQNCDREDIYSVYVVTELSFQQYMLFLTLLKLHFVYFFKKTYAVLKILTVKYVQYL